MDETPQEKGFARRPYLDGLRGIAILSVLFYHADFGLHGGFIGVDVFFVLSGFLIASIAVRDMDAGTFSLSAFWERRIRRIVPALAAVLLFSVLGAFLFVLYPGELRFFGNALAASAMFASNILFSTGGGYFDEFSRSSPLLHTWTLSVEEQFYILFPLAVLLCSTLARRAGKKDVRRNLLFTITSISVVSFALSLFAGYAFPDTPFVNGTIKNAAFYLLATRAWEIGIGVILALISFRLRSERSAELLSFTGIALILGSVFLLNDNTPFPGIFALLPVLGTAAVILANESASTRIGSALSTPILVWFGLISYSLYLWHWPLLSFATFASSKALSLPVTACIAFVSIAIAWLSYRFIETPFRKPAPTSKRSTVFVFGLGILIAFFCAGVFVRMNPHAFSFRIPSAAQTVFTATEPLVLDRKICIDDADGSCRIGYHDAARSSFLVWGDSQAHSLLPVLDEIAKSHEINGVLFHAGGCPPVLMEQYVPEDRHCAKQNKKVVAYIENNDFDTIILTALWRMYISRYPDFEKSMRRQVQQWSDEGRTVYIMKQIPEQRGFSARTAFYQAIHTGNPTPYPESISSAVYRDHGTSANTIIDSLAELPNVYVIDPSVILCDDNSCPLSDGKSVWYHDAFHLNLKGIMRLAPLFEDVLAPQETLTPSAQ